MSDPTNIRTREIWNRFIEDTYPIVRGYELQDIPAESEYFVVMVEPRPHPHMEYVLRNVMHFLGPGWGLQIFAGQKNKQFVDDIIKDWGNVHVYQVEKDNLTTTEYNQFKKLPGFWKIVKGQKILWLEPDCLLCRSGIEEFLQYDYIGAPWPAWRAVSEKCRVGNGGLSLRSRATMLEISTTCNTNASIFGPEDVFFVVNMQLNAGKYRLPSVDVAERFAVETMYYDQPFGLHKPYEYLTEEQVRALLNTIRYT